MTDPKQPITITTADVARLLHHPEPESNAARLKVCRLVRRGLPKVPFVSPAVFIREQVHQWLADEAKQGAADVMADAEKTRRPARRRAQKRQAKPAELSPIQARLAEMRKAAS